MTVADIRLGIAEETAELVRAAGGEAIAVECNVADETQVAKVVARTISEFGSLWGLVANAGTAGWAGSTKRTWRTGSSCWTSTSPAPSSAASTPCPT